MKDVKRIAPIKDIDGELKRISDLRIISNRYIRSRAEGQLSGFVVSWFFQPTTAVRGIASHRLLKYSESKHYVLFNQNTGSSQTLFEYGKNIEPHELKNREFPYNDYKSSEWYLNGLELFENINIKYKINYVMTNSVPIPDHNIGMEIKKRYSCIKWIAFFSDPMSNNDHFTFYKREKILRENNTNDWENKLKKEKMKMREYELQIYEKADLLLFPQDTLARYMLGDLYEIYKSKIGVVPHSFESYVDYVFRKTSDKIVMSFIGSLYALQKIDALSEAISLVKKGVPNLSEKLRINIIGNAEASNIEKVRLDKTSDVIQFLSEVTHEKSIEYMTQSDFLISLQPVMQDRWLGFIRPAKLADYMSVKRPILLFGDANSESEIFARNSKNIFCIQNPNIMAYLFQAILEGRIKPRPFDLDYYNLHLSKAVSNRFDEMVSNIIEKG